MNNKVHGISQHQILTAIKLRDFPSLPTFRGLSSESRNPATKQELWAPRTSRGALERLNLMAVQQILNPRTTSFICLLLLYSTQIWGLPWLQIPLLKSEHPAVGHKNAVDFSGTWIGQCNNQPAADLSIEQRQNKITLRYSFMEEKYIIGVLKTETASKLNQTEAGNSSVTWNKEHNALVFINTQQFSSNEDQAAVFFSKVSMSLSNGDLIINGEYFQSTNEPRETIRDTLTCVYAKENLT